MSVFNRFKQTLVLSTALIAAESNATAQQAGDFKGINVVQAAPGSAVERADQFITALGSHGTAILIAMNLPKDPSARKEFTLKLAGNNTDLDGVTSLVERSDKFIAKAHAILQNGETKELVLSFKKDADDLTAAMIQVNKTGGLDRSNLPVRHTNSLVSTIDLDTIGLVSHQIPNFKLRLSNSDFAGAKSSWDEFIKIRKKELFPSGYSIVDAQSDADLNKDLKKEFRLAVGDFSELEKYVMKGEKNIAGNSDHLGQVNDRVTSLSSDALTILDAFATPEQSGISHLLEIHAQFTQVLSHEQKIKATLVPTSSLAGNNPVEVLRTQERLPIATLVSAHTQ